MNDIRSAAFTGERFIPGKSGARIERDHLNRYLFAARYAKNKSVLDIACGSGYGAQYLMSGGAKSYTGVDISPDSVEYARRNYLADNVSYECGDICQFSSEKKYDLVTCFETIEHVTCYREAVSNLSEVLSEDGLLIVSSPNRPVTSPRAASILDKPKNQFHTQEFTPPELCKVLEESGFVVDRDAVFGQRIRRNVVQGVLSSLKVPDVFAFVSSPSVTLCASRDMPRYFLVLARKKSESHSVD